MKKIYITKIVLFIGVILAFILNMNIKSNQVSEIDNRVLTEFSSIFSGSDITDNIENYINDRIGFRTNMMNFYNRTMDLAFGEMVHPNYQYGEDGYIFFKLSKTNFDEDFQEVYSDFIKDFEDYCNDRDIDFLYTLEPSKDSIYTEFLPKGYVYNNLNSPYFINLLENKGVNFLNNTEVLRDFKSNIQIFDRKFDAGHWNETGALIGISAILDKLNDLDNRVGSLDINKFNAVEHINKTLPVSYFPIEEKTTHYNLIEDNSEETLLFQDEIELNKNYTTFAHYKNNANLDAPKILIFAGSFFNNKDKFLTENFSEVIKVHNYHNVVNYDYYINIFNPDIVLFESTEYTHSDSYFPRDKMRDIRYNKSIKSYLNLKEDNFVNLENAKLNKSGENLIKFSIPINSEDVLYSYSHINNRILDCKINLIDGKKYVEFSIPKSEIENLDNFDLYFISKDEERYQKISINY